MTPQRILVVGAGHVGLYTALRLSRKLKAREAEVIVVDPQPHMTYQPFLPEAAAGSISPRHAVVPLRRELRRCTILAGEHVQYCSGGGAGTGAGPGGSNPWALSSLKKVAGSASTASHLTMAFGVSAADCNSPPNPPPGVAWFSSGHGGGMYFVMGDGSAPTCAFNIDIPTQLTPALTAAAQDDWPGF